MIMPAEQILGPARVVPGIASVLEIHRRPELAWVFLSKMAVSPMKPPAPSTSSRAMPSRRCSMRHRGFGTAFT
jgi:hypothetical protein